ncbi:MAG TPA: hypothetical protein VMH87_03210, partial [Pseudomonadales bacterium]|nr:hypothetical protein [Pseudomonadales bacterium]
MRQKVITLAAGMALAMLAAGTAPAISLDDIQLWAGSGTNRAAVVIEWNSPELFNNSTVPAPVTSKTMAWGYRFNGTATGAEMLNAILAADPKLYVVETNASGTLVAGIGYNLSGNGRIGITDGTITNVISHGILTNMSGAMDSAYAINGGDLYWGGLNGPRWQTWTEGGDAGEYMSSPNRGQAAYWTATNADFSGGYHGQWSYTQSNLDALLLTNGSWIGFSVAAAGRDSNPADPAYNVFNHDKQAPPSPDGTYVAYVPNMNDFGAQVFNATNVDSLAPYNDPTAILGRPSLRFYDPLDGSVTDRVSVVDPPYNVDTNGNVIITKIDQGGEVTINMGRRVYANPNNPYGADLIVYGYSFFFGLPSSVPGGFVSDTTDLSTVTLTSSAIYSHPTIVSVSQDGVSWFTYTNMLTLFPEEAFRWDETNMSWTAEEMNPTKPLNPYLATNNLGGQTISGVLDQFSGATGGTSFSLQGTGLSWIQYIRLQAETNDFQYTVIDAVAAVNPAVVGDALSIAPDNIATGNTNLFFQRPDDSSQNQVTIGFGQVNEMTRISTVSLNDFSSFASVEGKVSSAYQIMARPLTVTNAVALQASVGLWAGDRYSGNGNDLRVFQWNQTNWMSQPF